MNMPQSYIDNPELMIDKVREGFLRFEELGRILTNESKIIYENLAKYLHGTTIEAGSGIALGAQICPTTLVTDKDDKVVRFNKILYPNQFFDTWDISLSPYGKKFNNIIAIEVVEHVKDYKQAIQNLIASANQRVIISTPNRLNAYLGQDKPWNPAHVHEFTPIEMIQLIGAHKTNCLDWKTFEKVRINSDKTPMIYEIWLH